MSDKLVFDLSQEIEGSPNVFIRKDWLNILDNQNQNYNNNQSVVDTSQLSNSNKWMNYREAYFSIPFVISLAASTIASTAGTVSSAACASWLEGTNGNPANSPDDSIGLKNWFGQIIHSFTLDYNGTTIIQQTPFINMWNSFKLLTSLSYNDLITQGDVIGFYPDDATSWEYNFQYLAGETTVAIGFPNGNGICNNTTTPSNGSSTNMGGNLGANPSYNSGEGNIGLSRRIQNINFDLFSRPSGTSYATSAAVGNGGTQPAIAIGAPTTGLALTTNLYGALITSGSLNNLWKGYIFKKTAQCMQTAVMATVYLKQLHSFFNMVPLLKGVFMKMTMNLNNTSVNFNCSSGKVAAGTTVLDPQNLSVTSVSNAIGGVCPLMISSPFGYNTDAATSAGVQVNSGSYALFPNLPSQAGAAAASQSYILNLSVGATCLNTALISAAAAQTVPVTLGVAPLSKSIYLYIPAYTFNPPFEQAYLSSPTKVIKYTDVYQYQILNVSAGNGGQINNLVTNGIANIKSVLVIPFYSTSGSANTGASTITFPANYGGAVISTNTGFTNGIPVFQSPFDPAGCGCTSPLCLLTNFNVQISGQNAIYNVEKYAFEQFNNQLYGQNSVNGGLTDGLCSGLIGRTQFDMEYCYYYVNVERMLPVEETVPKSVQILGTNSSTRALDLYVFIEYGMEVKIDALTGARV